MGLTDLVAREKLNVTYVVRMCEYFIIIIIISGYLVLSCKRCSAK